jgi:SAM-dependent methyltransferase
LLELAQEKNSRPRAWHLHIAAGNAATLVILPGGGVRVAIETAGTQYAFDIQLNLPTVQVKATRRYSVRFRARADAARTVFAGVAQAYEPWDGLGMYEQVDLTPEWRDFEREFVAAASDDQARLHFDVGASGIPVDILLMGLCELAVAEGHSADIAGLSLGMFDRLTPVSRKWGFDRGLAIDRYYIESFLARHGCDLRGRALEIEENRYTGRFSQGGLIACDVLHVSEGNPNATIVGDLSDAPHIPSEAFDCAVITQTLQLIYNVRGAVQTLHRILKPGGVLLVTVPGITRISHEEWAESWFWLFTSASAKRVFGEFFGAANVEVESHGNVLAAISFLHGLARDEFRPEELDYHDPDYEVIITIRAVKPPAGP